jgi:hypothetical protein
VSATGTGKEGGNLMKTGSHYSPHIGCGVSGKQRDDRHEIAAFEQISLANSESNRLGVLFHDSKKRSTCTTNRNVECAVLSERGRHGRGRQRAEVREDRVPLRHRHVAWNSEIESPRACGNL